MHRASREDRSQIAQLQGMSQDSDWTRKPTTIQIPSNGNARVGPPRPQATRNPFGGGRMSNNLHNNHSSDPRPNKRPRTNGPGQKQSVRIPPPKLDFTAKRRDTDGSASRDGTTSIAYSRYHEPASPDPLHLQGERGQDDGPHTQALRERREASTGSTSVDVDHDPISDFSDDAGTAGPSRSVKSGGSSVPLNAVEPMIDLTDEPQIQNPIPGQVARQDQCRKPLPFPGCYAVDAKPVEGNSVQGIVKHYEQLSDLSRESPGGMPLPSSSSKPVAWIDFEQKTISASKKHQMRGKFPKQNRTTIVSKSASKTVMVPVVEWFKSGDLSVSRPSNASGKATLAWAPTQKGFEIKESSNSTALLRCLVKEDDTISMTRYQGKSSGTLLLLVRRPSDETVLVKFDPSNGKYYSELYTSVQQIPRKLIVEHISGAGAESLWDHEISMLGMQSERDHEDSSEKPKKRPRPETESPEPVQLRTEDVAAYTGQRRSTRISEKAREGEKDEHTSTPMDLDELILIFPPSAPGAVNITTGDLRRLVPGEFLNDKIIEFGLKSWLKDLEDSNPLLASDIFIFSSYFYKKMNVKNHEEGFNSVRRWTSKIDLFQKKFLIIPINENLHWYLAIIYLPEYVLLPPPPPSPRKPAPSTRRRKYGSSATTRSVDDSGISISESSRAVSVDPLDSFTTTEKPRREREHEQSEMEVDEVAAQLSSSCISTTGVEEQSYSDHTMDDPDPPSAPEEGLSLNMEMEKSMNVDKPPSTGPPSPIQIEDDMTPQAKGLEEVLRTDTPGPVPIIVPSRDRPIIASACELPRRRTRGGQRRHSEPQDLGSVEVERDPNASATEDDDEPVVITTEEEKQATIFTLDSMGGTHRQAGNVLKAYLSFEAKDKKQNVNPNVTAVKKMPVPQQNNYCDCGLYLLHFVRKFVEEPESYVELSRQHRLKKTTPAQIDREWNKSAVADLRETLTTQINTLSAEWKAHRNEQKRLEQEAAANGTAKELDSDSDDEVCLVEDPTVPEVSASAFASSTASTTTTSAASSKPVSATSNQANRSIARLR